MNTKSILILGVACASALLGTSDLVGKDSSNAYAQAPASTRSVKKIRKRLGAIEDKVSHLEQKGISTLVPGPVGPQGPEGEQGVKGETGPQGLPGLIDTSRCEVHLERAAKVEPYALGTMSVGYYECPEGEFMLHAGWQASFYDEQGTSCEAGLDGWPVAVPERASFNSYQEENFARAYFARLMLAYPSAHMRCGNEIVRPATWQAVVRTTCCPIAQ